MSERATLFIGHLAFGTDAERLQRVLEHAKVPVLSVTVPRDDHGFLRTFAFVEVPKEAVKAALKLDGKLVCGGNEITIKQRTAKR